MQRPASAILGFPLAIALVVGCAPQHRATSQKLPASLLAEENGTVAKPSTSFSKSDKATAEADAIRQVELTAEDLQGTPALPSGTEPPADLPITVPARTMLDPPAPASLPSRTRETLASEEQTSLVLPQRTLNSDRSETILSVAPSDPVSITPMRRVEARIETMARQLEATNPALVNEFLAATRQGVMVNSLDQVLTVWQATIDHGQRSSQVSPAFTDASRIPDVASSAPVLPRRTVNDSGVTSAVAIRNVTDEPIDNATRVANTDAAKESPSGGSQQVRLSYGKPTESEGKIAPADEQSKSVDDFAKADELEIVPTNPREDLQVKLRQLAREMESSDPAREEDRLRWQVYSRLLYLMADDNRRALNPVEGTENIDRKYWRSLLWSMIQYFDAKQTPRAEARAAETVISLQEATAALKQRADLEISTPILCSKVDSFGVYEEFGEYKFKAGQTMVVYWEIRNFSSVETKDGFRTRTAWAFEIIDSRGDRRQRLGRDFGDDLCRNQRQDYFNVVKFTLPADLTPGEYVLKVISTDKTTDKVAERQIRFVIK